MKLNVKRWGSLALSLLMATQTVGIGNRDCHLSKTA